MEGTAFKLGLQARGREDHSISMGRGDVRGQPRTISTDRDLRAHGGPRHMLPVWTVKAASLGLTTRSQESFVSRAVRLTSYLAPPPPQDPARAADLPPGVTPAIAFAAFLRLLGNYALDVRGSASSQQLA